MYIDEQLRTLPVASASRRFGAYCLDRLLLLLIPAFSAVIVLPIYLLIQVGFSAQIAKIVSFIIIALVYLFTLIYGNWLRVGENAQTLGMSLMNVAIASDHTQFSSKLMNKWFFWVNISTKDMTSAWSGDEIEERTDAQLWRGMLPTVLYPMLAGLVLIGLQAVGRLPFVLWSLFNWAFSNGQFHLGASNNIVSIVLAVPVVITFVVAELGFLFAFGKEGRTLGDHFLGIKLVDVRGTEHSFQPKGVSNLIGWFMGNKRQESLAR
jgi:RDD family